MNATPTTHPAVRRLQEGQWTPEQFREHVTAVGHPLQERVSEDEIDVTYVLETRGLLEDDTPVRLHELIGSGATGDRVLRPVGTSGFRALTLRMRSDVRLAYAFTTPGPDGPRLLPDPLNPPLASADTRLGGSVLELPDAEDLPYAPHRLDGLAPEVVEHTFASELLGNERRLWVSVPPGGTREGATARCVIVFDGTAGHSAPAVRDALARDGQIEDVVVVLVDQIGLRDVELTANPTFSRMVAHELVPWLREHYDISTRPTDVALSGSSYGGLCAAWTALQHPDVIGNALIQSPSCWYHPDLSRPGEDKVVGEHSPTPTLIRAFVEAEPVPVRIYHEVGRLEGGPPPAQVRQILGNRWLHDVLRLRGYDTRYREFAGGHDALWWRATWADGLRWLFPTARLDYPDGGG